MNIYDMTTKELAQRLDTIEDMDNGKPGEHRALRLELERRDVLTADQKEAFRTLHLVDLPLLPTKAERLAHYLNTQITTISQ